MLWLTLLAAVLDTTPDGNGPWLPGLPCRGTSLPALRRGRNQRAPLLPSAPRPKTKPEGTASSSSGGGAEEISSEHQEVSAF